ncbi:MAG TPA: hypothetical protein PKX81_03460 [Gemmiger formicilis]|nr:hypothetical protein [Gemmiger formicilis]
MSVKRLLDCAPSELARYTKAELLDAIAGSEGRVLACETIEIAAAKVPAFKSGKALKDAIQ